MAPEMNRRQFVLAVALAGGATMLDGPIVLGEERRRSTLLPRPDFYWGVGIENCWIAQTDPERDGNRRLLDVFLQMQHYEKWKRDLDLAAEVGVNAIRYSVPWYKAEPKPGVYDWSWIDKPIDYLVNKLKIIPIMDIIHYGTPTWMPDGVIDERFPEALAAYASAMATHFKGLVNHYTPHNEPQVTALFCGLIGRWPPYQKSVKSWSNIGAHVAKAMILETRALREALPDPVLVSADVVVYNHVADLFPTGPKGDLELANYHLNAAAYPSSLAYGKVDPSHPFAEFLQEQGVPGTDLEWCYKNANQPDILGVNYYPDIFRFGDQGDFTRKGKVPLHQAAQEAVTYLERNLRLVQCHFGLPAYLTETSAGLKDEAKVAYMDALYERIRQWRHEGFPLVGMNWWPLFQTIQWDYREKVDKPLEAFLYPGLWNNGLYVIDPQPDGDLKRVPTPAASNYREIIRKDTGRTG